MGPEATPAPPFFPHHLLWHLRTPKRKSRCLAQEFSPPPGLGKGRLRGTGRWWPGDPSAPGPATFPRLFRGRAAWALADHGPSLENGHRRPASLPQRKPDSVQWWPLAAGLLVGPAFPVFLPAITETQGVFLAGIRFGPGLSERPMNAAALRCPVPWPRAGRPRSTRATGPRAFRPPRAHGHRPAATPLLIRSSEEEGTHGPHLPPAFRADRPGSTPVLRPAHAAERAGNLRCGPVWPTRPAARTCPAPGFRAAWPGRPPLGHLAECSARRPDLHVHLPTFEHSGPSICRPGSLTGRRARSAAR